MKIDKNGYSARSFLYAAASSLLAMVSVAAAGSACAAGETIELIPKVWFTEPPGVKRMSDHPLEEMGSNPWLDPAKNMADFGMLMGSLFKTVADWDPSAGKSFSGSFPMFAVRVLDDKDADALLSQEQFLGKVRESPVGQPLLIGLGLLDGRIARQRGSPSRHSRFWTSALR